MPAPSAVVVGEVFAERFRLLRLIGAGEMGTTFAAEPAAGGEKCAVKILHAGIVDAEARRRVFADEVLREARVESEHVVRAVDAGVDPATGRPWLATELLDGEDLASRVSHEALKPAEARAVLTQLCAGLGAAHARGVVHHILTPDNVFLASPVHGDVPFTVKLRELGLARFLVELFASDNELLGTPIWMAPEQFTMGAELSTAANVWTLGLLAFYLFTGRSYWLRTGGGVLKSLLREIVVEPLARPSERAAVFGREEALPRGFDAWFARCVAREVAARFADARVAGEALQAMLDGAESPRPDESPSPRPDEEFSEEELDEVTTMMRVPASALEQLRRPTPTPRDVEAPPPPVTQKARRAAAPARQREPERETSEPPREGGWYGRRFAMMLVLAAASLAALIWSTSTKAPPEPAAATTPPRPLAAAAGPRVTRAPDAGAPDAAAASGAGARD